MVSMGNRKGFFLSWLSECLELKKAASQENRIFVYAKTKAQVSCAVTAQLISAFVFASRIVNFLFFLNPKFQASSYLMQLHRLVCVGPGQNPRRPVFSRRGSFMNGAYGIFSFFFYSLR